MTSTGSIARTKGERGISEAITSRIRRGIEHYEMFGAGIEKIAEGVYLVPSSTGYGKYRVETSLTEDGVDHCQCVDFARHGEEYECDKHTVAAMIFEAKNGATHPGPGQDMLEACYTGLEQMAGTAVLTRQSSVVRYGLGEGAPYDTGHSGEGLINIYEYIGESRRLITSTGSITAAERDVIALREGRLTPMPLYTECAKCGAGIVYQEHHADHFGDDVHAWCTGSFQDWRAS